MTTRNDLAAYQRSLQDKIKTLQFLGSNLSKTKNIHYEVTLECGSRIFIEQRLIPFNLEMELRTLIDDSIDHYQRMLTNAINGHYGDLA